MTSPLEVQRGPVTWAASYLGVSVTFLNRSRLVGDGPVHIKAGRKVIYDRADLDAWLSSRRRSSTSSSSAPAVAA